MLLADRRRPAEAVGAELDDYQVTTAGRASATARGSRFVSIASLDAPAHHGRYDGVVCMEVLEHVVELDVVIDRLWRLLAADGTLLVSVPVETGLPLLVKQAARRIAGWRGIGDYPGTSPYTWREYCTSVFAGSTPHLTRPVYGERHAVSRSQGLQLDGAARPARAAVCHRSRRRFAVAVARTASRDAGLVRRTEIGSGGRFSPIIEHPAITSMSLVDAIVLAAVPRGCTPDCKLARAGFSVTLFEEHQGIGEPVHCTGVLAREAFEEFGLSRGSILNELSTVKFYAPSGDAVEYSTPSVEAVVVDRMRFDQSLAEKAAGAGVQMHAGRRVTSVEVDRDGVRVTAGTSVARGARVRPRVRRQLRAPAQARARHAAAAAAFGADRAARRTSRRRGSALRPQRRAAGLRVGGSRAARSAVRAHRRHVRARRRPSLQRRSWRACRLDGESACRTSGSRGRRSCRSGRSSAPTATAWWRSATRPVS